MDKRFIYVFDEESRDKLLGAGYRLVCETKMGYSSEENKEYMTYVFDAGPHADEVFALDGIKYCFSSTLTF